MVCKPTVRELLLGAVIFCSPLSTRAETVLLEFSSATCGPCQEMRPVMHRLAAAGFHVREIDIEREPLVASHYRVSQVPTFVVLVDGQEADRAVGIISFEQLNQILDRCSSPPPPRPLVVPLGQSPQTFATPVQRNLAPIGDQADAVSSEGSSISPQVGRIVEIQEPAAEVARAPATVNPFVRQSAGPPPASLGSLGQEKLLVEATVKITVEDPEGTSAGTGTIVDARSGEALVLTCGHIFRTSEGKGASTVTLFQLGAAGVQESATFEARMIDFDLERDLALLSFRPNFEVRPVRVAPLGTQLTPGAVVTTVGCDFGANPIAIRSRVTAKDRYQGPPNVEVAGAPVEGRSGCGLFNAAGQLVGVCFAADPQDDEGLYAALPSVYEKLESLGLAMVYEADTPAALTAINPGPAPRKNSAKDFTVRGQEPQLPLFASVPAPPVGNGPAKLKPAEQAALEEIQQRGVDSEVICIIRPRDPRAKSEVITLPSASPEFVRSLTRGLPTSSSPRQSPAATAAAGQLLR